MTLTPKQKRILKIVSIIIVVCVVLGALDTGIVLALTRKDPNSLGAADQSEDRLSVINSVLASIFGPRWIGILITFAIILIVFLFLFYLLTKKDISINDRSAILIERSAIAVSIAISLAIIVAAVISLVQYFSNQKKESEISGDFATTSKAKQTVEIIGISLGILIFLGFGIGIFLWLRKRRRKKNKS